MPAPDLSLQPASLFLELCRRVVRDGRIDPGERRLLLGLRGLLRLDPAQAEELLAKAKQELGSPRDTPAPMTVPEVFRAACSLAFLDDELETREMQLLEGLGRALKLDPETTKQIFEEVRYMNQAITR